MTFPSTFPLGPERSLPAEDSFYLYHRAEFRSALSTFAETFAAVYPRVQLALSVKTNYLPALLRDAVRHGAWAEVVSAMEYRMVAALGVPPAHVVFNGPVKGEAALAAALRAGALVQLDSPAEIDIVARTARATTPGSAPLRVAVRINFPAVQPASPGSAASRFGFDPDAELGAAVGRLRQLDCVRLEGLSAHLCTRERTAAEYRSLALALVRSADQWFPEPPRFLNAGGGFLSPAPEEYRRQFDFDWTDFPAYAEAVGRPLRERYGDQGPTLLLEPGLAVEARALSYLTRVTGIRRLGGVEIVQVAGTCYDIKPTKHGKNLPVARVGAGAGEVTCTDALVVGNTCMEDDVLYRGLSGRLAVGDYLHFHQVGAYTLVLRPAFISARPPVYVDHQESAWRRVEPAGDWQAGFHFVASATEP